MDRFDVHKKELLRMYDRSDFEQKQKKKKNENVVVNCQPFNPFLHK